MKIFKNHRHLQFVIVGSLLLLGVLEGIWLKKLYADERHNLREKINQTLNINMTKLQVTYMQQNNVRLIDSFFSEKEKHEKDNNLMFFGGNKLSTADFMLKSHKTYFATLDSLSNLKLGSGKDNETIDSFLNVMREYYNQNTPSVSKALKTEKDSIQWVESFVRNQKTSYTSLWHLYRLDFSPQLNRKRLDSFMINLRSFVAEEQNHAKFTVLFNSEVGQSFLKEKVPIIDDNADKATRKIQIFIKGDTNLKKTPSKRDSFLSSNAYQFQRYISTFIEPEAIKMLLDTNFNAEELTFEVSRMSANDIVPHKGNALIVTTGGGERFNKHEKIGVAVYGYQPYIFKKIAYEIFFALFVFIITALSFWLIYRSFLEQKRLIVLKNDFISNVTHELKTPITTVGVAIEAMSSFDALKNPAQTKEYLDISKNELNRLSLLVDKVLKMAAFEQKETHLTLETLDLAALTQQVLDSMKLQFEKYNATISLEKTGTDFNIEADRTHITSIIYNLIDNALKYGGDNPTIHLELQSPFYDFVRLSVADSGQGIPPQYQSKIFEKFFRIPTGDVHNIKGHGLGLSYVASVVKQHGGKLNVESEVGKGSRFSVFLPMVNN